MCSVFIKFKGGKGVATSAGMMIGIFPYYTLPLIPGTIVFVIAFLLTRYISVGSISAAIAFAAGYVTIGVIEHWPITGAQLPLLCFALALPAAIIYKHRGNIARLRAGTEPRFATKATCESK
jgi:glycerol-3-phosphate acyltransferase PlsY